MLLYTSVINDTGTEVGVLRPSNDCETKAKHVLQSPLCRRSIAWRNGVVLRQRRNSSTNIDPSLDRTSLCLVPKELETWPVKDRWVCEEDLVHDGDASVC